MASTSLAIYFAFSHLLFKLPIFHGNYELDATVFLANTWELLSRLHRLYALSDAQPASVKALNMTEGIKLIDSHYKNKL